MTECWWCKVSKPPNRYYLRERESSEELESLKLVTTWNSLIVHNDTTVDTKHTDMGEHLTANQGIAVLIKSKHDKILFRLMTPFRLSKVN